jgi:flagellar biosynthesis protein FlhF
MNVKKFKAKNLQEALRMVRDELGSDASVLQTRELANRRLLRWFTGAAGIEVTASTEVNVPSRISKRRRSTTPRNRQSSENHSVGVTTANASLSSEAPTGDQDVSAQPSPSLDALREQLLQLQSHVHSLRDAPNDESLDSDVMFRAFTDLIEADMAEDVARTLIEEVSADAASTDVRDLLQVKAAIRGSIESSIQISGELRVSPGESRLIALIGPTGVGKTTTIAKLAANYRLRENRKVALITVDTYRIAAVDQLQTYADIIDVPMEVVSTPREMRAAIDRLRGYELILMDTAGRSPRDEIKLQELKSMLAEAQPDEVHLVLSAVNSTTNLVRAAERFAAVGTTSLVLTKLDEATGHGQLLSLVHSMRLPLSYVTDGQNVPDDIEPANAKKLAHLMLGGAGHSQSISEFKSQ